MNLNLTYRSMIVHLRQKNTNFYHFDVVEIIEMVKINFVKKRLMVNRLKSLETKVSETIFLELIISSKKLLIVFE